METHSAKIQVITDADGKVLGTRPIVSPEPSLGIEGYSRLVAGPEQELHEIEVELPERLLQEGTADELHEYVQQRIAQNSSGDA
jgi:hypothetical protein